ncbi:MAG: hypothetical protein ABIQ77_09935, partial [Anaerolineales bacterium]
AEKGQVQRLMQLADRVSVNLEAPNTERLKKLAPHKVFIEELLRPLKWVEEIRLSQPAYKGWNGRWPSTVTQFVAGGSDESDLELLTTTDWLMKNVSLKRAYFSAFRPISDTPLENKAAVDPRRELLRIPGIGPKNADAILLARRAGKLCDLTALRKMGIVVERLAPFVLLDGRRADQQLMLF